MQQEKKMKKGTVDRLKIKGTPAPRNTPTSPLLSMSKANRATNPSVAAVDRSYEFILRKANRKALEQMPAGPSHITRRMDFLNRIQSANFGISTMDSPYITSEETVVDDRPKFVLCGQPLNGYSPKSFIKYFSDQRVGNFKTSAHEIYRARHNIKTRARSEPTWRTTDKQNGDRSSAKTDFKDTRSIHSSSLISVPSLASESVTLPAMRPSPVDKAKSSFELKGRSFKPVNGLSLGFPSSVSGDFMISKSKSRVSKKDKKETDGTTSTSSQPNPGGSAFLHINNDPQEVKIASDNGAEFPKHNKSFGKKGIRYFNNPYRLLKHRERQVAVRTQNLDMKSVQKIANMSNDAMSESEKVLENLPGGASSEQLLLEMMFESNKPNTRRSISGKYSDIALHRDLDEYMVVRTPPSSTRDSPVKSHRGKSGRRYLDELEEESHWAGNDINEVGIINRNLT
ncbi:uncharacterized protein LOC117327937 [Pecten maximus]|uniref:uncharacterized protein LOC117327937 n=1 Tax=Pecten maximus TaxID=6579 RepID=UPI001458F9D8|nr:uncharacterized protein LOC117327937 [Pecten maximus]XP_033741077.1 uncharacterized protein LOC117327937 [Pecten maximus]